MSVIEGCRRQELSLLDPTQLRFGVARGAEAAISCSSQFSGEHGQRESNGTHLTDCDELLNVVHSELPVLIVSPYIYSCYAGHSFLHVGNFTLMSSGRRNAAR
jgi:hypothetical protein